MGIWFAAVPVVLAGLSFLSGCNRKENNIPEARPSSVPIGPPKTLGSEPPSDQNSGYTPPAAHLTTISFNGRNITPKPVDILRVRVDLAGDPKLGTLFFLRNYHTPGLGVLRKSSPDYQMFIIASQWKSLQLLDQLGANHIFYERNSQLTTGESFLNELKGHPKTEAVIPLIQQLKGITGDYPPYGMGMLNVDIGAPFTYAVRNPKVVLHPVFTPEEQKISMRDAPSDIEAQNFIDREAWATREMIQFLKKNPGASVVLVFGGIHNFCDNFIGENFKPRIISAWFEFPKKIQLWPDQPPTRVLEEWNITSVLPSCP